MTAIFPRRPSMTGRELFRLYLATFGATAFASALVGLLASHLIWNWTPSLPLGLYWLSRGTTPEVGRLVAFPVPMGVRSLVRERRYLPPGAVLVKPVVATAGDQVCARGGALWVNGANRGAIPTEDSARRPLPSYMGCGPVPPGLVYVASHYAKSFDSRTFGPVAVADVRGRVTPLWTY
jgi:conjugative transfer signal peptidase TraF